MRRRHLVEIHDLKWCPKTLRNGLTDFLEQSIDVFDIYGPVRPILLEAIQASGADRVVDLCSGGGGPWPVWQRKGASTVVSTVLTDKYPNAEAQQRLSTFHGLEYTSHSVDATRVPPDLTGFRTLFSAFHHFDPSHAKAILGDAIAKQQPIGIFEFTYRTPLAMLFMMTSAFGVWGFTPRMPNRTWLKLLLTYVIPLIPLIVTIDGIVSCLRTYRVQELREMAGDAKYRWKTGECKSAKWPLPITYFVGYPDPGAVQDPNAAQDSEESRKSVSKRRTPFDRLRTTSPA